MEYSDITDLLSSAGTFLLGIAAVIKNLKEKEPKRIAKPRKFK